MLLSPSGIHDAVLATAGETLWVGGKRVDGYFTQNCGGHTADAAEVWGGAPKSWLRAHEDPYCQRQPAQWHASVGKDELLQSLQQEGFRVPSTLTALHVVSRESSGRAKELELSAGRAEDLCECGGAEVRGESCAGLEQAS